jgi:toxic protein SymE
MAKQASKRLKIYSLNRSSDNKEVPQLKISGVWIEQLGFKIGGTVNVTTRDRLLIIEPVETQKPEEDYKAALQEVKNTLKKLVK